MDLEAGQEKYRYEATAFGGYRADLAVQAAQLASKTNTSRPKKEGSTLEFARDTIFHATRLDGSGMVLVALVLLGACAGTINWCVDRAVEQLQRWTSSRIDDVFSSSSSQILLGSVLCSVSYVFIAVLVTSFVSPSACGSGIPEMKAILSGVTLKNYLSMRTLLAKVSGVILALSAGLVVGKEGPFVHTSSICANQLLKLGILKNISANTSTRQSIMTAAVAVGVSTTFRAPIGGVLFGIEATSVYYILSNYWKAMFAASIAAAMDMLADWLSYHRTQAEFKTGFTPDDMHLQELSLFVLLGVFMGLISALEIRLCVRVIRWRRRWITSRAVNVLVSMAVAALTAVLVFVPGQFNRVTLGTGVTQLFSSTQLLEEDGWASPSDAPLRLQAQLLCFCATRLFLLAVSISLPLPTGCFLPMFAVGAGLGRMFGEGVSAIWPHFNAGAYALVGAAALTGGFTHTLSAAVIACEMSGQLHHILPVLLANAAAYGVSVFLTDSNSIYVSIMKAKRLPYLPHVDMHTREFSELTAADVMRPMCYTMRPCGGARSAHMSDMRTLARRSTYRQLLRCLLHHSVHGTQSSHASDGGTSGHSDSSAAGRCGSSAGCSSSSSSSSSSSHVKPVPVPVVDSHEMRFMLGTVHVDQLVRVIALRCRGSDVKEACKAYIQGGAMVGCEGGKGKSYVENALHCAVPAAAGAVDTLDIAGAGEDENACQPWVLTTMFANPATLEQRKDAAAGRAAGAQIKSGVSTGKAAHIQMQKRSLDEVVDLVADPNIALTPPSFTVRKSTPLGDIHVLFCMLRCEYVYVQSVGELVGIVDRESLLTMSKGD